MPLTGRAVCCRKGLAEDAKAIDVAVLRAKGFFKHGAGMRWTSSWTCRGEPSGAVNYWREDRHGEPLFLWFSYNVQKDGGDWRSVKYPVGIASTRCHFGGLRHWFICPLVVNGRACGRRSRFLYLAGSAERFGCRECQRLTYESRRSHRDRFWGMYHKHEDYVERAYRKYKPARGRKAKERRARLLAIAERRACYGVALIARMLGGLRA